MDYADKFLKNINDKEELDKLWRKLEEKRPYDDFKRQQNVENQLAYVSDYVDEAQARIDNWGKLQGLSTGFVRLDEMTGGLVGGELVIIAGQTSHGKSQLAANIAYNLALRDDPVLFVTLEMTKPETTSRFMKIYEYDHAGEPPANVAHLPIIYQLQNELEYRDIGVLMWKAKESGAKAVVIDHLHYFPRGTGENIRNEIGRITKHFKEMAIQYDIPVVLISHTRRLADSKSKPTLSDLKESGYIEQDADIVLMVWRDLSEESISTDLVDVSILKNRNRGFNGPRVAHFFVPNNNGVKLIENSK